MSVKVERRADQERRQFDAGPPPGCDERRRCAERRLPRAEETEISADEFTKYFGPLGMQANASK